IKTPFFFRITQGGENKNNFSGLSGLGKWNPKLHSMKVSEAVNDILGNIKNKNTGTYIYHSGKIISKSDNENLWEKTFKLYIQEDAILYDVNKKEYYTF
ncbi:hypothetical protein PNV43_14085, partial [[Ruminococcus] gnavus]|nr:hypothetical protein [Mediterraneibacter gnavus]MDB8695990.1 hypothetical protein [Mediterraneibacter gnavus]MDB8702278.1 hypothetical protein [Mediterraneibacter gnavus]